MNPKRRVQLIKRCAVANSSPNRLQNYLETGDLNVYEINVRLDKLPSILKKSESAQYELQCQDEADYSLEREEYKKNSTLNLRQVSVKFCILWLFHYRLEIAKKGAACQVTVITLRGHIKLAHTLSYQP